jgi:hypothetical protein
MTVIGTAMLHQWQFFAMGCSSIALLLVANHYDLLKDRDEKNNPAYLGGIIDMHPRLGLVLKSLVVGIAGLTATIKSRAVINI